MSRKREIINPIRGERLRIIIKEVEGTKKGRNMRFAEKFNYTPEHISQILRGNKNLPEHFAREIVAAYPLYRIEWLLGVDDYKTLDELKKHYNDTFTSIDNGILALLNNSLMEVCLCEGIEVPTLDNIPELLFLEAQIKDYADSLMWNYIKRKQQSHIWSFLSQAEESIERKRKGGAKNG